VHRATAPQEAGGGGIEGCGARRGGEGGGRTESETGVIRMPMPRPMTINLGTETNPLPNNVPSLVRCEVRKSGPSKETLDYEGTLFFSVWPAWFCIKWGEGI